MIRYLLERLGMALLIILATSTLVFGLVHLIPGDPLDFLLGENAALAGRRQLRLERHLQLPILLNLWPLESHARLRARLLNCHAETQACWQEAQERAPYQLSALSALSRDAHPQVAQRAHALLEATSSQAPSSDREASHAPDRPGKPLSRVSPPAPQMSAMHTLFLETQLAWFFRDLARGDFLTLHSREPVLPRVLSRLAMTARLGLASLLVALSVAIPLGTLAAWKQSSLLDRASVAVSLLFASLPNFWLGPLFLLFFAVDHHWFPVSGADSWRSLCLPALTLGLGLSALLTRVTRGAVLETLRQDYIRAAKARGFSSRRVLFHHALRNALLPVVTVLGLQLGAVLSGSIITEQVFAWPGLGRELVQAIQSRDFPLIQGCVLAISLTYVTVNLLTDLLSAWLDPRIRLGGGR